MGHPRSHCGNRVPHQRLAGHDAPVMPARDCGPLPTLHVSTGPKLRALPSCAGMAWANTAEMHSTCTLWWDSLKGSVRQTAKPP